MSGLVQEILDELRSGTLDDVGDAAARAVSLLELSRGQTPFIADLRAAPEDLSGESIETLVRGLTDAVQAAPTSPRSAPMVWALGKRFDDGLRPLFLELLDANLEGSPDVLYQAIIALSNLDDPALADVEILSIHDEEENRRLALTILERR